jgi:hypothetical protein
MSKSLHVPRGTSRYETLSEYIDATGKRKNFVARVELGIEPSKLSELLKPGVYRPQPDDALIAKIATLLNQPESYVRDFYRKAAA